MPFWIQMACTTEKKGQRWKVVFEESDERTEMVKCREAPLAECVSEAMKVFPSQAHFTWLASCSLDTCVKGVDECEGLYRLTLPDDLERICLDPNESLSKLRVSWEKGTEFTVIGELAQEINAWEGSLTQCIRHFLYLYKRANELFGLGLVVFGRLVAVEAREFAKHILSRTIEGNEGCLCGCQLSDEIGSLSDHNPVYTSTGGAGADGLPTVRSVYPELAGDILKLGATIDMFGLFNIGEYNRAKVECFEESGDSCLDLKTEILYEVGDKCFAIMFV